MVNVYIKAWCTQAKMGRGIAEQSVFWVKKTLRCAQKTRRSAEFGNRNFSIFGRAAERKWVP